MTAFDLMLAGMALLAAGAFVLGWVGHALLAYWRQERRRQPKSGMGDTGEIPAVEPDGLPRDITGMFDQATDPLGRDLRFRMRWHLAGRTRPTQDH